MLILISRNWILHNQSLSSFKSAVPRMRWRLGQPETRGVVPLSVRMRSKAEFLAYVKFGFLQRIHHLHDKSVKRFELVLLRLRGKRLRAGLG